MQPGRWPAEDHGEMLAVVAALVGLPAGFALDALVARLAVPPDGGPAPDGSHARPSLIRDETGVLALPATAMDQVRSRRLGIVGATVGLFAIAGARYDAVELPIIFAYVSVLLVCAATDAISFRVPNVVTYPAALGALLVGVALPEAHIAEVAAGGAVAGGALLLPALITRGAGMGMGDVKLAFFVGLALGFFHIVPALLLMALLGGGAAALLLATGLRGRGDPIPYAPFISAGALAALLWQGAAFVDLS